MFSNFNIKCVLTNERKIVCLKAIKIDPDLDHVNLNINNDYSFSSGNLCTKFDKYQANGS